ncbi:hypothetical protein F140042L4_27130 [Coprococcus phoceensis]
MVRTVKKIPIIDIITPINVSIFFSDILENILYALSAINNKTMRIIGKIIAE